MGSYISQEQAPNSVKSSTLPGITTPKKEKDTTEFDPRSPSGNVDRTPVKVDDSVKLLNDPRSPLAEVNRTPIGEQ
jgi:hypothetical protein